MDTVTKDAELGLWLKLHLCKIMTWSYIYTVTTVNCHTVASGKWFVHCMQWRGVHSLAGSSQCFVGGESAIVGSTIATFLIDYRLQ